MNNTHAPMKRTKNGSSHSASSRKNNIKTGHLTIINHRDVEETRDSLFDRQYLVQTDVVEHRWTSFRGGESSTILDLINDTDIPLDIVRRYENTVEGSPLFLRLKRELERGDEKRAKSNSYEDPLLLIDWNSVGLNERATMWVKRHTAHFNLYSMPAGALALGAPQSAIDTDQHLVAGHPCYHSAPLYPAGTVRPAFSQARESNCTLR